jgi:hypothetical protein
VYELFVSELENARNCQISLEIARTLAAESTLDGGGSALRVARTTSRAREARNRTARGTRHAALSGRARVETAARGAARNALRLEPCDCSGTRLRLI